jgi:hypothetical protein
MDNNFIEEGKQKYDTIPIPEDLEINIKRTLKKAKNSKKSLPTIKLLGGFSAAVVVFILLVNLSPNLALALDNLPLIKHLVQLVNYESYDSGFNKLVDNERFQEINLTAKDKGAKFTVTSIVGDDLKLWIGYEFQGQGLATGQIKFKTKDGNKELPWMILGSTDRKKYLDVQVDKLVKDFIMEIPVYKDNPLFKTPVAELDEEALKNLKDKWEQSQLTTLSIPISLNNKIYKQDLAAIDLTDKEYRSEIGVLKFNSLQFSEARSIVYLELLSDDYELVRVENPRLFDGKGNMADYHFNSESVAVNNKINIELEGGIKDYNSLTFECSDIKYLAKKDKQITIDINSKVLEPNNLGIELVSIEGNIVTLNTTKGNVDLDSQASLDNSIVRKLVDYTNRKQVLEFKSLPEDKIILNVKEADNSKINGFDLELGD